MKSSKKRSRAVVTVVACILAVCLVDVPGAVIVRVGTGSFIKHRNSPF